MLPLGFPARSRHGCRAGGPPVLQPYRDLLKLIRKQAVLAENASWLFRSGPYMIFAATWVAAALVPTFATGMIFSWAGDLIAIIALIGSARFFLALTGMDIGTSFGGIGSSREMLFASPAGHDHDSLHRGPGRRLHATLSSPPTQDNPSAYRWAWR
jgi:formate hydrogenlyase subunit 4